MEDDLMCYTTARRRFTTKRFARQPAVVALIASLIAHETPALLAQRAAEGETREVAGTVVDAENADHVRPAFLRELTIREAVHLAQSSVPVAVPSVPKRSWASRHPVVLGTLIGVGGVSVLAAAHQGNESGDIMAMELLVGAGAGALGGLIASASQKAKLKYEAPTNQPDVDAVKRLVARLGTGARIIVRGVNTRETTGTVQAIQQDNFTIVPDRQAAPVQITYSEVRVVKAARGLGMKIGIAAGIIGGFGLALVCGRYCGGN